MANGYNKPITMFRLISQINNLRFEGNVCEVCDDSIVYQISEVTGIEGISTTSDGPRVKKDIEGGGSCEVNLRCCGCGDEVDFLEAGVR